MLKRSEYGVAERSPDRQHGFSLLEVTVAFFLVSTVALGVLGGLANAMKAQRDIRAQLQSVQLRDRMVEELQSVAFDGLIGFDGTYVEHNDHRADLTVVQLEPSLIQIQVDVTSTQFPSVSNIGVLLIADPN